MHASSEDVVHSCGFAAVSAAAPHIRGPGSAPELQLQAVAGSCTPSQAQTCVMFVDCAELLQCSEVWNRSRLCECCECCVEACMCGVGPLRFITLHGGPAYA